VLAEPYNTGGGWINFPVYTFSGDQSYGGSCWAIAACARAWPPVVTSGKHGWVGPARLSRYMYRPPLTG
jgi:hypothetical protein